MSDEERRDAAGRQRGRARAEGRTQRSAAAPSGRARTGDPARAAAFEVLRQVDGSDAYANLVLPPLLRARRITGRDAAFATELAYGTLRMRGRYDAILEIATGRPVEKLDPPVRDVLRLGAHQVLGMRVPPHAAVSETVALTRALVGAGPAQLVNAALRRVSERTLEDWLLRLAESAEDETERLSVAQSHPAWIVRAMRQALVADGRDADELDALLEADNAAPAVTLVARPGLAERDVVLAGVEGGRAGRWTPTAVRMPSGDPAQVAGVSSGRVGVQDEGSQLVALALAQVSVPPRQGPAVPERWLDLCAGPGGKAALLGAVAAARGAHLVANEIAPHRAVLVERSVGALPPGTVEVRVGDGTTVGEQEPAGYDRVLVDAPCTGLGALRRRPEARWRRTPADLGRLSTTQRDLLSAALDATRPGGVVAYVTCSPHLAETTLVVKDVVGRRADVEVLDAREAVRAVVAQAGGAHLELGPGPRRAAVAACPRDRRDAPDAAAAHGLRPALVRVAAVGILIAPSILSADFANLEAELGRIASADLAHVDVMDNHFVPNLTLGLPIVERLVAVSPLPIDVHLMIEDPDRWAPAYAEAGASSVTFHAEAARAPVRLARELRRHGARAGLALRPATPIEPYLDLLGEIDMILVMTVEPGFGGQAFLDVTLPKIRRARQAVDAAGLDVRLQVDGGISAQTIERAAEAGANVFVAGSAVFGAADLPATIAELRELAGGAHRHA